MHHRSQGWWEPLLQNRKVGLVLAMVVCVTLLGAPASAKTPSAAPIVLEGFAILLLASVMLRTRWNVNAAALRSFVRTGPNLPILAFLAIALISCVFSHNRPVSVQNTLMLASGILIYFVVAYQFRRTEQLARLFDTLALVAIAGAMYGCTEYSAHPENQATGLFGDHQLFGSFLMILLPFMAVASVTEKVLNRKLVAQVATVLSLIGLMLAQSRSAWIGGAVGLIAVGALLAYGVRRSSKRDSWKQETLFPAVMILIGVGFFACLTPSASSFFERADTLLHAKNQDAWKDRQITWNAALRMIRDYPIIGVGAGVYPYYHFDYAHTGIPIRQLHIQPSLSNEAHNLYLQTGAELGVPAIVVLLAILAAFWIPGVYRVRRLESGQRRDLLVGSLGATAAFAVDAFSSPSWQFGQILMFFWVALGLGVTCMVPVVGNKEDFLDVARPVGARFRRRTFALTCLSVAALVPAAYATMPFTTDILYASVDHIQISPSSVPAGTPGTQFQFQAFIFLTPTSPQPYGDGPITLDYHTQWTTSGYGLMVPDPGPPTTPIDPSAPSHNAYLDYETYASSARDLNHRVTITATYNNAFSASSVIVFGR